MRRILLGSAMCLVIATLGSGLSTRKGRAEAAPDAALPRVDQSQ